MCASQQYLNKLSHNIHTNIEFRRDSILFYVQMWIGWISFSHFRLVSIGDRIEEQPSNIYRKDWKVFLVISVYWYKLIDRMSLYPLRPEIKRLYSMALNRWSSCQEWLFLWLSLIIMSIWWPRSLGFLLVSNCSSINFKLRMRNNWDV